MNCGENRLPFVSRFPFTFCMGFFHEISDVIKRSFLQCNFLCHSIMLPFQVVAQQNENGRGSERARTFVNSWMCVRVCVFTLCVFTNRENKSNFQVFKEKLCSHCVTRSFSDDIANSNEQKPDRTSNSNSKTIRETE